MRIFSILALLLLIAVPLDAQSNTYTCAQWGGGNTQGPGNPSRGWFEAYTKWYGPNPPAWPEAQTEIYVDTVDLANCQTNGSIGLGCFGLDFFEYPYYGDISAYGNWQTWQYGTFLGRSKHKLINGNSSTFICSSLYTSAIRITVPAPDPCTPTTCTGTPILVPLQSANVKLSGVETGPLFDLDGDGTQEHVAWPEEGTAFLAWDRDGDGLITSGRELFGDATFAGMSNGFDALASLTTRPTVIMTAEDAIFRELLLWHDANRDGVSQAGELSKASDFMTGIALQYTLSERRDQFGNYYRFKGAASYNGVADPRPLYDVMLMTR